jgi:hypothetical protein
VTIEAGVAFPKLKLHVKDDIKRSAKTLESFVRNSSCCARVANFYIRLRVKAADSVAPLVGTADDSLLEKWYAFVRISLFECRHTEVRHRLDVGWIGLPRAELQLRFRGMVFLHQASPLGVHLLGAVAVCSLRQRG